MRLLLPVLLLPLACGGDGDVPGSPAASGSTDGAEAGPKGPGTRALELCARLDPALDLAAQESELDRLAEGVRSRLGGQASAEDAVRALITTLGLDGTSSRAFTYEDSQPRLDLLLRDGRGNCVALSTLYLAVGQRAGLDVATLVTPGHQYVRLRLGDEAFDVETTEHAGLLAGELAGRQFFFDEAQKERCSEPLAGTQWVSFYLSELTHGMASGPALGFLDESLEMWPENRWALAS